MNEFIILPTSNIPAEQIAKVNQADYPGTRYAIWRPDYRGALYLMRHQAYKRVYEILSFPPVRAVIHGATIDEDFYIIYYDAHEVPPQLAAITDNFGYGGDR